MALLSSLRLFYLMITCISACALPITSAAQPATTFAWETVQTCAADPITPPDGWRFDGVLITAYPDDGVRGLRAETFQTYYIAFAGSNFIAGGALSPSGAWYAVPYGYIQTAAAFDFRYKINELRVYSTAAYSQLRARIAWRAEFQVGSLPPITWLDDETLSFAQGSFLNSEGLMPQLVKPFANETPPMPSPYRDYLALSPDLTRGFRLDGDRWGVYNLQTGEALAWFSALANDAVAPLFRWSADSQQFAITQDDGSARWLTFVNRDGASRQRVIDLTTERRVWNFAWSPSGQAFAFSAYDPYKDENRLYIGDSAARRITDTCVLLINQHSGAWLSGLVWSPDGTQLALVTNHSFEDPNALQIFDLASGTRYGAGGYSGGLVGWGLP